MDERQNNEKFVQELIDAQRGLYTFILRLLPNVFDANDVLQETNLVILRKQSEYSPGSSFTAWAAAIAHNQVRSFRLKMQRQRLFFDEELVSRLAAGGVKESGSLNSMLEALDRCKKKLVEVDQELLERRYGDGLGVAQLAAIVGRTPRAVSQALYRIRVTLLECIRRALKSTDEDNERISGQ